MMSIPLRRLTALATTAIVGALTLTAAPAATAADRGSDYTCDPIYYRIKAANRPVFNELALTVALSPGNHGSVIQYQWSGESNQKWKLCRKRQSNGTEQVVFRDAWRQWCMGVDRAGTASGVWVITVGCDDNYVPDEQKFTLVNVPNTNYTAIQSVNSSKWLAAQNFDTNGSQVVLSSTPDLWVLELA
ncbi:RICIN domain-containing protein [Kitasatospora sp. NPDC086801]|uniref:RICIN domain-containing protein n=1 Tax=Kitasatospora sp. NPDC086801 TaxID=3364066 RepID=UPI00381A476F